MKEERCYDKKKKKKKKKNLSVDSNDPRQPTSTHDNPRQPTTTTTHVCMSCMQARTKTHSTQAHAHALTRTHAHTRTRTHTHTHSRAHALTRTGHTNWATVRPEDERVGDDGKLHDEEAGGGGEGVRVEEGNLGRELEGADLEEVEQQADHHQDVGDVLPRPHPETQRVDVAVGKVDRYAQVPREKVLLRHLDLDFEPCRLLALLGEERAGRGWVGWVR